MRQDVPNEAGQCSTPERQGHYLPALITLGHNTYLQLFIFLITASRDLEVSVAYTPECNISTQPK